MPRFSVVVPAYNATATLPETLDAMLAQEFADWECVVVDDGSTDDTGAMAERYAERDGRFKAIHQQNTGTAGAYRTGIEAASSDLLVICAADDLLLPAHLRTMDEFIRRNPDCDIYSSNGEYLYHETGERESVYTTEEWQHERSLTFEQVVEACFFSVGVVFRRRVFEMTGGHRPGVYVDDFDLWLRAMARGAKQRYTPAILSVHRISSFQQSAAAGRVCESNIEVYENLMREVALPPERVAAVQAAIEKNRETCEWLRQQAVQASMEEQSERFRRTLERYLGVTGARVALRILHSVTWIARPFRRGAIERRIDR